MTGQVASPKDKRPTQRIKCAPRSELPNVL